MMDFNQINQLKDILSVDDTEEQEMAHQQSQGSVFTPGDIGGQKKEVAAPNTKLTTTVNARDAKGGAKKEHNIWKPEEVQEVIRDKNETREKPEFDIMFRQMVGAEDVFLGMSNLDPSSTKCQELTMKIYLPNTNFKDVTLEVTDSVVNVQTSKYFLYHVLPYKVNDKEGNAKWISDKHTLQITLPIVREYDFL